MTRTETFSEIICGDQFDIRTVIDRFEELEDLVHDAADPDSIRTVDDDDRAELKAITEFLDEVKGYGGDHQWRGDWYPVGFVADHRFEEYAEELAEDIGAINRDARWPNNCIDWKKAARELQQDYSTVEIDGTTYWYR